MLYTNLCYNSFNVSLMCVLHFLCVGLFVDVKFCKNVQHNEKLHSVTDAPYVVVNTIWARLHADILFWTGIQHKVMGKGSPTRFWLFKSCLSYQEWTKSAVPLENTLPLRETEATSGQTGILILFSASIVVSGPNAKPYSALSFTSLRKCINT